MGCICRGLDIWSTKPILDEHNAHLYVNHVEEKFLSHLHCMVFGDLFGGMGALIIQTVPLSHQFIIFAHSNHVWEKGHLVHFGVAIVSFFKPLISIFDNFHTPQTRTP